MEENHGTTARADSRKELPSHVNICKFNRPRGFSTGRGPSDVLKLFIQPRQFEILYVRWSGGASRSIDVNVNLDLGLLYFISLPTGLRAKHK